MENLLWIRHIDSFTLDYSLMRNILLTYVTGEETGLEKSGNLEKSGKVFNDTESVSARTEIQNLALTPKALQLMTEEKLNRKAESSSFCTDFSPLPLAQLPLPQIYSSTSLFCDPGGRPHGLHHLDSLAHWLLVRFGQWEALGGNWRSVGEWDQVVYSPLPSCFNHVFDSGYVPSWLQLLPGRPLFTGSSSH